MTATLNSKSIALTIIFAAIAVALNAVKIPSVFYPGAAFQFVQIPVIVAFLLFGVKIGVFVGVLNLLGALILFPLGAAGFIAYPLDFVSLTIMFVGLYLAAKLLRCNDGTETSRSGKKHLIGFTVSATVFRSAIMPFVDYAIFSFFLLPVAGATRPEAFIIGLVPAFIAYNAIVALYTVPIAYVVASNMRKYLNMKQLL